MDTNDQKRPPVKRTWAQSIQEQQARGRAIRAWVGAAAREQLAWVLDGVVYGRDVAELTYPARAGLWACLAHLVESVTEGRWRIGRPDPEPIEQYTSHDADRAPWRKLPPDARALLEFGRDLTSPMSYGVVRLSPSAVKELTEAQEAARKVVQTLYGPARPVGDTRFVTNDFSWTPKASTLNVARKYTMAKRTAGAPSQRKASLDQWWQGHLADAVTVTTITLLDLAGDRLRACSWTEGKGSACGHLFVATKGQKWCLPHQGAAERERNRRAQAALRARVQAESPRQRSRGPGRPRKRRTPIL